MKKNNLLKKLISLLLAVLIIGSTIVCTIGTWAEDLYLDRSATFDIFNEKVNGADPIKTTFTSNKLENNVTGLSETKYNYIPSEGGQMIWNYENFTSFSVRTFNMGKITEEQLLERYIFEGSADGADWKSLTATKNASYKQEFSSTSGKFVSYQLDITNIPKDINYIKLTSTESGNKAWHHGIIYVALGYRQKVLKPEFAAVYKNQYGYYANELTAGSEISRDVRIRLANMIDDANPKVSLTLNGSEVNAADYLGAETNEYEFTSNGEYCLTAENAVGKVNFNFKIAKTAQETIYTETIVDDIYNTGKTLAISKTNYRNNSNAAVLAISKSADFKVTHLIPEDKYYLRPYNNAFNEPYVSAVWQSDLGFANFIVETINVNSDIGKDIQAFYESWHSFYTSPDGENWKKVDFRIGATLTDGICDKGVSRELIIEEIPDGTKYMKYLCLITPTTTNSGYKTGLIRVRYNTPLPKPEVNALYKNYYNEYANKLVSGGTAANGVKLSYDNMTEDQISSIIVKKDGVESSIADYFDSTENAHCFTEAGKYSIIATNEAGATVFDFKLVKISDNSLTKTVVDDIYNTGKTLAISRTDFADAKSKVVMNLTKSSDAKIGHMIPEEKYFMWPYNSGRTEPTAEAVWYSEIGFKSFTVETLNIKSVLSDSFYQETYSFYTSEDGKNWKKADFRVGDTIIGGINKSGVSVALTVDNIPESARYFKFLSLINDSTKNIGYASGIIRARYTTYILPPEIDATYKNYYNEYANKLVSGGTAANGVKLSYDNMTEDQISSIIVKKDGVESSIADYFDSTENAHCFTEAGKYSIIATNEAGATVFDFKLVKISDNSLTKTVVDDIYNTGKTLAISRTDFADAKSKVVMNLTKSSDAKIGHMIPEEKYFMWPYNSGRTEPTAEAVWYSEIGFKSFTVETLNIKSVLSDSFYQETYSFYTSEDGKNWKKADFRVGDTIIGGINKSGVSVALTVDNIPESARYFKFLSLINDSTKNIGYASGIIRARYTTYILPPEIDATYKNYYGVYANELVSGGKAIRDVRIGLVNMSEAEGGEVVITKDGTEISASDYYNSAEDAYIFTQDGQYSIVAKNKVGTASHSFKIAKVTEDSVVTKTVVDDIYNTGKTLAISKTDFTNDKSKVVMSLVKASSANATNMIPGDKYFMHPFSSGKYEPMAEAVWYSERGFGSFIVETLNHKNYIKNNFYENTYSFYVSEDGKIWKEVEFEIGELLEGEVINDGVSRELIINKIPDGTKYIKFLSLITHETKDRGFCSGLKRIRYTTYAITPQINACFKSSLGGYINPVVNGVTAPSEVKVDIVDVEEEVSGSFKVKKNGKEIKSFKNGDILTDNGKYEITAENIKGKSSISFSIDKSLAKTKTDTYVFSEGESRANDELKRLLAEQPEGAPENFTKGDGHVSVNDNAGVKSYTDDEKKWWALTDGGTKLTIGSDRTGYYRDGYFYFVNKDENGNKYSGISLKYTKACMSSFPTDAYLSVYTADKYDGKYTLVKPTSVVAEPITGAPAAQVYNAIYYLGGAGTIVKIKFNPKAPITGLWQGSLLSILELSKLSLPTIDVKAGSKTLVDKDVVQSDVKLNISDENYWFITKDGKDYKKPANNILTEDGYYTVTACNYGGTAKISFYIAKEIPVVQLIDINGDNMGSGETAEDNVRVVTYNSAKTQVLKNGLPYSTENQLTLDLNGKYIITAENDKGSFEASVTLNRPLPTLKAYDLKGGEISNGDTVPTKVTYSVEYHDTCKITLNGKEYTPEEGAPLTEEGNYVIEAENKAGKVSLSFKIKYNSPLAELKHAGNKVEYIDYEKGSKFTEFRYDFMDTMIDTSKSLRSDWTGFTGPVLRSTLKGDFSGYITYKCAGFKSFAVYAVYIPTKDMTVNDMYEIQASSNGKDFVKLSYTVERDISYITTGYVKDRLVAQNIPDNIKYMRVVINGKNSNMAWGRSIPRVEFSYNKEDVGLLDVDDILFMIDNAEDGSEFTVDLLNSDTIIPKKVFEKLQYSDKTMTVNILNKDLEPEYRLSFNGLVIDEAMDFNIRINSPDNDALKAMKKYDEKARSISFAQGGNWTMQVQLTIFINAKEAGKRYALYSYRDGAFELIDRMMATVNGYLMFTITQGGDYIFTEKTDLLDDEKDTVENESSTEDIEEIVEIETQEPEKDKKGNYIMVVNRKKFVPSGLQDGGLSALAIVLICVGSAVAVAAAWVVVFIIIKKNKKKAMRGN